MATVRDIIREWDNNGRKDGLYFTRDSTLDVTFEDILVIIEIAALKYKIKVERITLGRIPSDNSVEFCYELCDNIDNIYLFLISCYLGKSAPWMNAVVVDGKYGPISHQHYFKIGYKREINELLRELNVSYEVCSFIHQALNPTKTISVKGTKYLDEYCKDSQTKSARNI